MSESHKRKESQREGHKNRKTERRRGSCGESEAGREPVRQGVREEGGVRRRDRQRAREEQNDLFNKVLISP